METIGKPSALNLGELYTVKFFFRRHVQSIVETACHRNPKTAKTRRTCERAERRRKLRTDAAN